jgi:acetyl-CoA carboxylase biotin carboxyl carrier protein
MHQFMRDALLHAQALGLSHEIVSSSIRLTVSALTTVADVHQAVRRISRVVNDLRRLRKSSAAAPAPAAPKADNLITIKSPMIGTFYRSSGPGKPSFVEIGDDVTSGKVVCIIEAMKLFNEIESEVSGTIVKVMVENASPVEYDQVLFVVEPD